MQFYWVKTPSFLKKIFSNIVWDIPNKEKKIYLTFDDGPIPEVTEWVLDLLEKHQILATFFCIGDNIQKHPDVFERLCKAGHTVCNHTFHHLNGWKTDTKVYIENVEKCEEFLSAKENFQKLFRPPYGKIKNSQLRILRQKGYEVVLWDVLSADFDFEINSEKVLKNVLNNTTSGSVIVFHDSQKAKTKLYDTLPEVIRVLKNKGFKFEKIRIDLL